MRTILCEVGFESNTKRSVLALSISTSSVDIEARAAISDARSQEVPFLYSVSFMHEPANSSQLPPTSSAKTRRCCSVAQKRRRHNVMVSAKGQSCFDSFFEAGQSVGKVGAGGEERCKGYAPSNHDFSPLADGCSELRSLQ